MNGPDELLASYQTGTGVVLTWIDNSTDEAGLRMYRKATTETAYTKIGEVGTDAAEYVDAIAAENTTCRRHVNAYNTAVSVSSSAVKITAGDLTAPDRLKATVAGSQVSLTWHDKTAIEDRYEVWRRSADAADWTSISTLPANSAA